MAATALARRCRPGSGMRGGLRAGLPIMPLAVAFGGTFGLAAREAGLDVTMAVAMSAVTFAGSAQFAAVGVLAAGGSPLVSLLAGWLATIRYVPMGVVVAPHARGPVWRRFLGAQAMIDESWAVAHAGGDFSWDRMQATGALFWAGWVGGTALGAVGGPLLGDLDRLGLDGALGAIFLALAAGQIRDRTVATACVVGAGLALGTVPLLPAGMPVAAASAACLLALRR